MAAYHNKIAYQNAEEILIDKESAILLSLNAPLKRQMSGLSEWRWTSVRKRVDILRCRILKYSCESFGGSSVKLASRFLKESSRGVDLLAY